MKPVPSEFLSLLVLGLDDYIKNAEEIGVDAHSLKIGGLTLIAVKVHKPLRNECLGASFRRIRLSFNQLPVRCAIGDELFWRKRREMVNSLGDLALV